MEEGGFEDVEELEFEASAFELVEGGGEVGGDLVFEELGELCSAHGVGFEAVVFVAVGFEAAGLFEPVVFEFLAFFGSREGVTVEPDLFAGEASRVDEGGVSELALEAEGSEGVHACWIHATLSPPFSRALYSKTMLGHGNSEFPF